MSNYLLIFYVDLFIERCLITLWNCVELFVVSCLNILWLVLIYFWKWSVRMIRFGFGWLARLGCRSGVSLECTKNIMQHNKIQLLIAIRLLSSSLWSGSATFWSTERSDPIASRITTRKLFCVCFSQLDHVVSFLRRIASVFCFQRALLAEIDQTGTKNNSTPFKK